MKWNADIIRDTETNTYRAIITSESGPEIEAYGDGWKELVRNVEFLSGIRFPARKCFKWQRFSDFEQIAGIDASHTRQSCVVTMADRRSGWHRWNVS